MSLRASTSFAERICSGDMYWGEPKTALVAVSETSPSAPIVFASPKSSTFTSGRPSTVVARNMFFSLMSR